RYWDAVLAQVSELARFAQGQPLVSGAIALLVAALSIGGAVEKRRVTAEAQADAERRQRAIAREGYGRLQRQAAPPAPPGAAPPPPTGRPPRVFPPPVWGGGADWGRAKAEGRWREGAPIGFFAGEGRGGGGKPALGAGAVARLSDDRDAFPAGAAWISCEGL